MDKKSRKDIITWTAITCAWCFISFGHFYQDSYFWGTAFAGLAIAHFVKVFFMYRKYNSK